MKPKFNSLYHLKGVFLVYMLFLIGACQKEKPIPTYHTDGSYLIFHTKAVLNEPSEDHASQGKAEKEDMLVASPKSSLPIFDKMKSDITNFPEFGESSFFLEESGIFNTSLSVSPIASKHNLAKSNFELPIKQIGWQETSPLSPNTKYRMLLLDDQNKILTQVIAAAGEDLKIPVASGKTYGYVAYSFNDDQDPGAYSSTFAIGHNQRDFIYKKGTVQIPSESRDGGLVTKEEDIILEHKLARITVKFATDEYPGAMSIRQLSAAFESKNYFYQANFNLMTGEIDGEETAHPIPTSASGDILFENEKSAEFPDGDSRVKIAYFYTAKFDQLIQPMIVWLKRLSINLSNGYPVEFDGQKSGGNYAFLFDIEPVAGKSINAVIRIKPKIAQLEMINGCPVQTDLFGYNDDGNPLMMDVPTQSQRLTYQVQVQKPGIYHLTTDTVEGLYFSASGKFFKSGVQSVVLTASGQPKRAGTIFLSVPESSNVSFKVPVGNMYQIWLKTDRAGHMDANEHGFPTEINLANNGFLRLNASRYGLISTTFYPRIEVLVGTVNSYSFRTYANAFFSSENNYTTHIDRLGDQIYAGAFIGYVDTEDIDDGSGQYNFTYNKYDNTLLSDGLHGATSLLNDQISHIQHDGLWYRIFAKWKPRSNSTYETSMALTPDSDSITNVCTTEMQIPALGN